MKLFRSNKREAKNAAGLHALHQGCRYNICMVHALRERCPRKVNSYRGDRAITSALEAVSSLEPGSKAARNLESTLGRDVVHTAYEASLSVLAAAWPSVERALQLQRELQVYTSLSGRGTGAEGSAHQALREELSVHHEALRSVSAAIQQRRASLEASATQLLDARVIRGELAAARPNGSEVEAAVAALSEQTARINAATAQLAVELAAQKELNQVSKRIIALH